MLYIYYTYSRKAIQHVQVIAWQKYASYKSMHVLYSRKLYTHSMGLLYLMFSERIKIYIYEEYNKTKGPKVGLLMLHVYSIQLLHWYFRRTCK